MNGKEGSDQNHPGNPEYIEQQEINTGWQVREGIKEVQEAYGTHQKPEGMRKENEQAEKAVFTRDRGIGSSGTISRSILSQKRLSVFQPIAFTVHLDFVTLEEQSVENGSGEGSITEEFGPGFETFVGGDEDRSLLLEVGDELEEKITFKS